MPLCRSATGRARIVIDLTDSATLDDIRMCFCVKDPLIQVDYIRVGERQVEVLQNLGKEEAAVSSVQC